MIDAQIINAHIEILLFYRLVLPERKKELKIVACIEMPEPSEMTPISISVREGEKGGERKGKRGKSHEERSRGREGEDEISRKTSKKMCIALDARRVRFLRIDIVLRLIIINDDDRYIEQGRCCSLDVGRRTHAQKRIRYEAKRATPCFESTHRKVITTDAPKV